MSGKGGGKTGLSSGASWSLFSENTAFEEPGDNFLLCNYFSLFFILKFLFIYLSVYSII